jgi:hypothetical protein
MLERLTNEESIMFRLIAVNLILSLAMLTQCSQALGQMFGGRQVGRPIDRQPGPGSNQQGMGDMTLGSPLEGTERFIRGARDAGDFVGTTLDEAQTFVGQVAAGAQTVDVEPAFIPVLQPDMARVLNRPIRIRSPNSLMEPRLQIAFGFAPEAIVQREETTQIALDRALASHFGNQFEVSVAGLTATLRGVVRDEQQRKLAELMCLMEPGVSQVDTRELRPFDVEPRR